MNYIWPLMAGEGMTWWLVVGFFGVFLLIVALIVFLVWAFATRKSRPVPRGRGGQR
jgi:hypothetical protein